MKVYCMIRIQFMIGTVRHKVGLREKMLN